MYLTVTINRTDNPLVPLIVTVTEMGSSTAPVAGWVSKDSQALDSCGEWLARDLDRRVGEIVHQRNGKEVTHL
jgi:hypothetical protein